MPRSEVEHATLLGPKVSDDPRPLDVPVTGQRTSPLVGLRLRRWIDAPRETHEKPGAPAEGAGAEASYPLADFHEQPRILEAVDAYDCPVRAAFVYPNPRAELAREVAAGSAPDTALLGQNHLAAHGIEASIADSFLRQRTRAGGALHRVTWTLRELTLPWELDADVLVTPLATLLPLAAKLRRRPRSVLLDYGLATLWRRGSVPRRALLRVALKSSAGIACLSSSQRDAIVDAAGLDPARVAVLLLGVDERFFRPAPAPEDGYVLAVGKDLARDYSTLAQAVEGLGQRVKLVAHPRNLVDVELPANVEVAYGLSWTELRDAYAGAASFVLPLRRPDYEYGTDGSGLTALVEAMAMAKPVIVTERPIFRDYVVDGESCLSVTPEDPRALRAALERLRGDRELASQLGARSRELVEERFTTRRFARELADFLRSVAG